MTAIALTARILQQAMQCSAARAEDWAPFLSKACSDYAINTPLRLAHFLAQIGHESNSLRDVREVWGPTEAQRRYEGRADLGNTNPGDGTRFMGRGPIQTTGRANYRALTQRLRARGIDAPDFEVYPHRLELPEWGALAACDYWDMRGINALADRDDIEAVTRAVNGGLNGLDDRKRRLGWSKRAIAGADAALPVLTEPVPALAAGDALPSPALAWPIPYAAVALLGESEKLTLVGRSVGGVAVWGWGETVDAGIGARCTQAEADQMLLRSLTTITHAVLALTARASAPNQLGAMAVLAYSVGIDTFRKSTMLKAHNSGDTVAASRAFGLLASTAGGEDRHLAAYRLRLGALYLRPEPGEVVDAMPPEVKPESSIAASPIAQAAVATAGGGLLTAAKDATDQVGVFSGLIDGAKGLLTSFGVQPEYVLPALAVGVGVYIVRWRLKQRRGGWA